MVISNNQIKSWHQTWLFDITKLRKRVKFIISYTVQNANWLFDIMEFIRQTRMLLFQITKADILVIWYNKIYHPKYLRNLSK